MSSARDNILRRLRDSRETGTPVARDFAVIEAQRWSAAERVERFCRLMRAVNTEIHESTRAEWPAKLAELCAARQVSRLALAAATPVGRAARAALLDTPVETVAYGREIEAWREELFFQVDAGLSTAAGGIAETGSLFLLTGPDEPRLLSLVPPIHFVVLSRADFADTLLEMLRRHRLAAGMPTNVLLISGPSKTADIEQTLVYGVHGPKQLIVLLTE
ncbi:MAG TPA: lactate utilization protein C [Gammaproteobacteria bacterium]